MAGSGILGEVAPRTSQLPTLTLKGEYRRCDSLRAYRFLGGGAGLRWTPEYWRLGLEGERRRYFNTGRRGHIAEVRLGYAPSQRLDLDLGAGFRALPDTTADFFRCAVSACPRSWLRLTGNWGVNTSSTHAGRASVVCPAGLGLFISLIPGVGVSGRVSHARGNQPECDSLSYRADLDLKRPLLPWLSLSGGVGVGRIARPNPAGTFRVSLDGGIDFGKELKATLGFARKLEAGVAADQLGFSLYREGGVKKLALATVTGRVFLDRVRDRTFGPGDVPLRGLHVALNGTRAAVTDSRGRFAFPLLERGTYEVRLDPAGLPATQGCHSTVQRVTVSGLAVRTVSFAVCEMGQIAGRVFLDENRNGAYDDDDRSMPNIIVFLQDDVERLTVSNAKGAYLLANVEPGTYRMGIRNLPSGFIITTDGEPLVEVDGDGKVTRDFGIAPTPRPVRILNHEKGNHNRNRNHNRGQ